MPNKYYQKRKKEFKKKDMKNIKTFLKKKKQKVKKSL